MRADKKYKDVARIFQAFSNPTRLKILDVLISNCTCSKEGCCVNDINRKVNLPQPCISKHLKVLKECGILTYKKEGNKIFYSFNNEDRLNTLIDYLKSCRRCC